MAGNPGPAAREKAARSKEHQEKNARRTPLRVQELAMARDLNQMTLSFAARVSPTTVRGYWYGYVDQMDRDVLERLAEALGTTVPGLFGVKPVD